MIIPVPPTPICDQMDKIPFDRLTSFFKQHLT